MSILTEIQQVFSLIVSQTLGLSPADTPPVELQLNLDKPREQFGDLNTNIAMLLARQLKRAPQAIAQELLTALQNSPLTSTVTPHDWLASSSWANPGFINLTLSPAAFKQLALEINTQPADFFKTAPAKPAHYLIEFVSANPTGPLHLGHGRGAIIGDVLGNVLRFQGHQVTKEFYINDAGNQIQKLGLSFKLRCQQALGVAVELPEAAYHGDYLVTLAQVCLAEFGPNILEQTDQFFADYAKAHLLVAIQQTLRDYGVHFDVWFSELDLHQSGAILQVLTQLQQAGYTYEQDEATWFKSTQFGDDKDRVVRKSDGELTYVAADIAYLQHKVQRGADHLVMVLGQDHHSYAVRLQGLKQALGLNQTPLDIIIYQLVSMQSSGEAVRMSKRAGNIVTLRGVIDTVGADVARFFYLNRKADSQLEFNLDLALTKTEANPVYYIQYALVRIKSILRKAHAVLDPVILAQTPQETVTALSSAEYGVILKICELKQILAAIERTQQTHLLTYYALELARLFHAYYNQHQVLDATQPALSAARLLVLAQLEQTLALALELMGLSRPDSM